MDSAASLIVRTVKEYTCTIFSMGGPVALGGKKIRMDELGATVPRIETIVYLLRRKTCASFRLIYHINTQIL